MELWPIDQAANDRLLLEAEQRKRDLIEHALHKYAPHLIDKSDVRVIHLFSTNASLRKEIRSLCGGKTVLVEHVLTGTARKDRNEELYGAVLDLPSTADYVVTKSALNTKVEWLCARLQALPLVLPEASDYLVEAVERKQLVTMVGADQA